MKNADDNMDSRMDNNEDTTHTNPVISSKPNEIPLALQSIITQSDAKGQQIVPSYRNKNDTGSSQRESLEVAHAKSESPSSNEFSLARLLCCLSKSRTPERATSQNTNSYSSNTIQRSPSSRSSRGLPAKMPLIGPLAAEHSHKKCLALDLDETLVHSSFQPVDGADYVIPVTIEGTVHNVYVIKRPGVDDFLKRLAEYYEIIVYTASLAKYADPLLDKLDIHQVVTKRLFREHCVFHEGHYVKDLSLLSRPLPRTILVDNSPPSYKFHPENAIDCSSFIDDPRDKEMWQIADFLIAIASVEDVRGVCRTWRDWCSANPSEPLILPTPTTPSTSNDSDEL